MTIPSVMRGLIETEDGKVFEIDSPKGATWLETIGSFRYEPTGDGKPYTVRKEGKNGEYWYGCRKIEGKVRKKYIGKSSEVSVAKLEEIAEALEIPAEPRVNKVVEVAQQVAQVAQTPQVAEGVAESRVTALELQVAELLKTVKDIQEALPGKSDAGDSVELPKVADNEVVERLQNELSNLQVENKKLREDVRGLVIKLTAEQDDRKEVERQLSELKKEIAAAPTKPEPEPEPEQKSDTARDLPDAYDLLNQLKAKHPKIKVTPGDVEKILEILEES